MSCPKCVEGYELPGEPVGSIQADFLGAYFTPGSVSGDKRAVVLLTDAFGLPLKNCKIIADRIAKDVGCDVWVPDYFAGRPIIPLDAMNMPDKAEQRATVLDWIKFVFNGIPAIPGFIRNRASVVDARLESFFALLKEKETYEKIGAVGYCFGGATAIRLASTDSVNTVVIAHPAPFKMDQVRAIKVPCAWVCPEVDIFLGSEVRNNAEAELARKKEAGNGIEYEFHDYPGTQHGFACRPNNKYPELVEQYEKALEDTIGWFKKTL
ncbi:dienelactone hydrolase endo-1,3,1,4-beta-D-glucanase [Coprinellus micaceus]|uniref:Dienelactone hydrolase endo-1,3,1,4-beta-D-glucanase n=1 Tax=Coprinellus micaceus TaxID=71717 RepID=A0A4Y7SZV9_COPMI|nr:dienelactone hydrolase endo-1,3,1,4-beta-D-glucanase [Coprinellus micaceus]